MGRLQNLVPPLDLCKLIPAWEFADSCFVWVVNGDYQPKYQIVDKRKFPFIPEDGATLYPAPTLQEIMAELPACDCYRFTDKNEWTVLLVNGPVDDGVKSDSPATAALRLWLQLSDKSELSDKSDTEKGIEYAE